MANFFKARRDELKVTQRSLALALEVTENTIANWEDDSVVPGSPIAALAVAYDVPESRMAREVMAVRLRIEAREAVASR